MEFRFNVQRCSGSEFGIDDRQSSTGEFVPMERRRLRLSSALLEIRPLRRSSTN
ncbi:hypothetical protein CZ774_14760 [Frigoribacterium sp. JB110]|nr:hypothetical protein CZ774_14760 [Frigoribacterium sp. JB110]